MHVEHDARAYCVEIGGIKTLLGTQERGCEGFRFANINSVVYLDEDC